jgi:hypothetical protein
MLTLFQRAFRGILPFVQQAGVLSEEDLTRFWGMVEEAVHEQRFFARLGGFTVSGRKPDPAFP